MMKCLIRATFKKHKNMCGFYLPVQQPQAPHGPPKIRCKDWEIREHIGFGGTHCLWQMFSAVNKRTGAPGTVFGYERKVLEKSIFGKSTSECKAFMDFIKHDPVMPSSKDLGDDVVTIYEEIMEEGGWVYYVTEPLVCSLAALYYAFGHMSLSRVRLTAELEIAGQKGNYVYSRSCFARLLQYCAPDLVCYGLTSALKNLSALHQYDIIFGNVTPANVCVTPRGEWKLVGYACCVPTGLNFDFSSDAGALMRPTAHFMSQDMIRARKASKYSDAFQLASTVYTTFGERPCKYTITAPYHSWLNSEDLCKEAERMYGACTQASPNAVGPNIALQNAQTVPKYFQIMQQFNPKEQVCLSLLEPAMDGLLRSSMSQLEPTMFLHELIGRSAIAKVAFEFLELKRYNVFAASTKENSELGTPVMNRTIALLSNILPACLERTMLSDDFMHAAVYPRVVSIMARRDLLTYTVPLLMKTSYFLKVPIDYLCLLLDPVVIASTQSSRRPPKAVQPAFTTGFQWYGATYNYVSPFNDIPLDKTTKDRDKFIPNFDASLTSATENQATALQAALIQNMNCFMCPQAGARPHYLFLNMILSAAAGENPKNAQLALRYLGEGAAYFGDGATFLSNDTLDSLGYLKFLTERSDFDTNGRTSKTAAAAAPPAKGGDTKSELNPYGPPYEQPIARLIVPTVLSILKDAKDANIVAQALVCLSKLCPYMTEEDLGSIVLPAVHSTIDNTTREARSILAFAGFVRSIYQRCSGRSVASLFMPVMLKCLHSTEIRSNGELEQLRKCCDEIFNFVNTDVYNRASAYVAKNPEPERSSAEGEGKKKSKIFPSLIRAPKAEQPEAPPPPASAAVPVITTARNTMSSTPQQSSTASTAAPVVSQAASTTEYDPYASNYQSSSPTAATAASTQGYENYDPYGSAAQQGQGGYGYGSAQSGGYDSTQGGGYDNTQSGGYNYNSGYGTADAGYGNTGYGASGYDNTGYGTNAGYDNNAGYGSNNAGYGTNTGYDYNNQGGAQQNDYPW